MKFLVLLILGSFTADAYERDKWIEQEKENIRTWKDQGSSSEDYGYSGEDYDYESDSEDYDYKYEYPSYSGKKGSIRQWKENVKKDYGKWKEGYKYKESGDGNWEEDYEYSDSEDSGSGYDYNYGYDGKKGGYRRR